AERRQRNRVECSLLRAPGLAVQIGSAEDSDDLIADDHGSTGVAPDGSPRAGRGLAREQLNGTYPRAAEAQRSRDGRNRPRCRLTIVRAAVRKAVRVPRGALI